MKKQNQLLLIALCFLAQSLCAKPFTVVIDAGHGGKDPGAVGRVAREKDLNLDVALRLGKLIQNGYDPQDVRVVYTRDKDIFIPLQGRADIVNRAGADLFICIHTNSAENKSVTGAETFVLGTEKMDKNLDVAMRENAVMKLEADYQTTYQGFDPNSVDSYIMFEMMQNNYMDQSLRYATSLQRLFSDTLQRADRGVRQAAFWVLLKSACPSVLVEMGFISNRDEELYLNSEEGKQQMANAMLNAFQSFYRPAKRLDPTASSPAAPALDTLPAAPTAAATPAAQPTPTPAASAQPAQPAPAAPLWAVQILASKTPLPANDPRFRGLTNCGCIQKNGWYKYYYGASADKNEAQTTCKQLKSQFSDCYVVRVE